MNMLLRRFQKTDQSTIGRLYLNDEVQCYTLEDVVRPVKIPGETAIPTGSYNVIVTFSPHFQTDLPLLENVPNYSGVRIHPGNTKADTEGCILVGTSYGDNVVNNSRAAFALLFSRIKTALAFGESCAITVT